MRQQLDSFNEFINSSIQDIVAENATITVTRNNQHQPGWEMDEEEEKEYRIKFGQIYVAKPSFVEPDGETVVMFPKEARLRNLTYNAALYVDITKEVAIVRPDPASGETIEEIEDQVSYDKVLLGDVPIMLRSDYCNLADRSERDLMELGECPYDQGGYFVINGSEKVLIAQERMANNHVYVFRKSQPSKYSYIGECRSTRENSAHAVSTMSVKMLSRAGAKKGSGQAIRAAIPYVRSDIPILVLFRALGFVVSKLDRVFSQGQDFCALNAVKMLFFLLD